MNVNSSPNLSESEEEGFDTVWELSSPGLLLPTSPELPLPSDDDNKGKHSASAARPAKRIQPPLVATSSSPANDDDHSQESEEIFSDSTIEDTQQLTYNEAVSTFNGLITGRPPADNHWVHIAQEQFNRLCTLEGRDISKAIDNLDGLTKYVKKCIRNSATANAPVARKLDLEQVFSPPSTARQSTNTSQQISQDPTHPFAESNAPLCNETALADGVWHNFLERENLTLYNNKKEN